MIFRSVYDEPDAAEFCYRLLDEREPHQSISHKRMPSFAEHCAFVASKPYPTWMLMRLDRKNNRQYVGAFYITKLNEIGIGVLKAYQRQGHATAAMEWIMSNTSRRPLLANVNPLNVISIDFFKRYGAHHLQSTFAL